MNYNFTDGVRKLLARAREEALRLKHGYVGTEHILFGLLHDAEGVASMVLADLGVDRGEVLQRLEAAVSEGRSSVAMGELPYTSRGKKVLELALVEVRELGQPYVGEEHILLGLLAEERGIAAQVLASFGVHLDGARTETVRLLGIEGRSVAHRPRSPWQSVIASSVAELGVAPLEVLVAPGDTPPQKLAELYDALAEIHRVGSGADPDAQVLAEAKRALIAVAAVLVEHGGNLQVRPAG